MVFTPSGWPFDEGIVVGALDAFGPYFAVHSTIRSLTTWGGALVRIRRSSDNTLQDFTPLVSGILDAGAITSFIGAGTGFIDTMYDQTGNQIHAQMGTFNEQPTIDLSGKFPVVNFDPSINNQFLNVINTVGGVPNGAAAFDNNRTVISITAVHKYNNLVGNQTIASAATNGNTGYRLGMAMIGSGPTFNIGGRRLDTDASSFPGGIAADTNWHVDIGRWNMGTATLIQNIDSTASTNTSWETPGSSDPSDSGSVQIGILVGATNPLAGKISLVAWQQLLLTNTQVTQLVGLLAGYKAA